MHWSEAAWSVCCFLMTLESAFPSTPLLPHLWAKQCSPLAKMPFPYPSFPFAAHSQKSNHPFVQLRVRTFGNGQDKSAPDSLPLELTGSCLPPCTMCCAPPDLCMPPYSKATVLHRWPACLSLSFSSKVYVALVAMINCFLNSKHMNKIVCLGMS